MTNLDRRDFIKTTALISTGVVLADLSSLANKVLASEPLPAMSITRWDAEALAEADLSVVATRLTEETIRALGGMKRFVSKGDVVWVKPNIDWNRRPGRRTATAASPKRWKKRGARWSIWIKNDSWMWNSVASV